MGQNCIGEWNQRGRGHAAEGSNVPEEPIAPGQAMFPVILVKKFCFGPRHVYGGGAFGFAGLAG